MKNYPFLAYKEEHDAALVKLREMTSLRKYLSQSLGLNDCITFRKTTTLVIVDVIDHLLKDSSYHFFYSDIEHPCIQSVLKSLIPNERRTCFQVYKDLLAGRIDKIEDTLSQYSEFKGVYFFSHVLWSCGIVLDIEKVSRRIKGHNKKNITIIDGAQAVGNILPLFHASFDTQSIDMYVACTHKWLNTQNLLGFVSFSLSLQQNYPTLIHQLFLRDIFSEFAGDIDSFPISWPSSTYDLIHLLEIRNQLGNHQLIKIEIDRNTVLNLNQIELKSNSYSNYRSYYGTKSEVLDFCQLYTIDPSNILDDINLPNENVWLRV